MLSIDESDHGTEMVSAELAPSLTSDNPTPIVETSPAKLVVKVSGEDDRVISCTLNTLSNDRIDIDGVLTKTGIELFQLYQTHGNLVTYQLTAYDMTFELGQALTVYSLYHESCSITFSKE